MLQDLTVVADHVMDLCDKVPEKRRELWFITNKLIVFYSLTQEIIKKNSFSRIFRDQPTIIAVFNKIHGDYKGMDSFSSEILIKLVMTVLIF